MNENDLTPEEHADVRARLIAGAGRIAPVGRHRNAWIAGSVAVALVAVIAGGVGVGATLSAPPITSTPSPTATMTVPAPTPSATTTPSPTQSTAPVAVAPLGRQPFSGQCANVLSESEATIAAGQPMVRSDFRWTSGSSTVAGGIDCLWLSSESYVDATVHVWSYPGATVSEEVRNRTRTGCERTQDGTRVICDASGDFGSMWLLVRVTGPAEEVTPEAVAETLAVARDRIGKYPAGIVATPTAQWWGAFDCAGLAASLEPAAFGYERVAEVDHSADAPTDLFHPGQIEDAPGRNSYCDLYFTSGPASEPTAYAAAGVASIPGGAVEFTTIEAAEYGEPVNVRGAASAVRVPGNDRYEGSWEVLAVSDGVNVLLLSSGGPDDLELLVALAEDLLKRLG